MTTRFLVPFCWSLWGVMALGLVVVAFKFLREKSSSPEGGRGIGLFVLAILFIVLALAGGVLHWVIQREHHRTLAVLAFLLAYPVVALVASPTIVAFRSWKYDKAKSRIGAFESAPLRAMAEAIRRADAERLRVLLAGKPPPDGKDLVGNDLLTFALIAARDLDGSLDCVTVLLQAGADPRSACLPDGLHVLHYLVVSPSPRAQAAVRLMLQHGADANVVSVRTGDTPLREASYDIETVRALIEHGAEIDRLQSDGLPPLVNFVVARQWDSAIYLIRKGAALDFRSAGGLSLDSLLEEWRNGVYGERPDGFDRLSEAVAERRRSKR